MPNLLTPQQENQLHKWLVSAALINLPDETINSCRYLQLAGLLTTKNKVVLRLFLEQKRTLICYIDDSPDIKDKEGCLVPYQAGERLNAVIKCLYDAGLLGVRVVAHNFKSLVNHHDLDSLNNALHLLISLSNKLQCHVPPHALQSLLTTKQTKEFTYALLTFEQNLEGTTLRDIFDALQWGNLQNTYTQCHHTLQGQTGALFDSVLHYFYQIGMLHHLSPAAVETFARHKDLDALDQYLGQFSKVCGNVRSNVLQILHRNRPHDTINKAKHYGRVSVATVLPKALLTPYLHERFKQKLNTLAGGYSSRLSDAGEKRDSVLSRLHYLGLLERLSLTDFYLVCRDTDLYSLDSALEQWGMLSALLEHNVLQHLITHAVAINREKEIKQMLATTIFSSKKPQAGAENASKLLLLLSGLGWEYRDIDEQQVIVRELVRTSIPDAYAQMIRELQPGRLRSLLRTCPARGASLNSLLEVLYTLSVQERSVLICSNSKYRKRLINFIDRAEVLSTVLKSLDQELHAVILQCLGEKTLNQIINTRDDLTWILLFLDSGARVHLHCADKFHSDDLSYANHLAWFLKQIHEAQCTEKEGLDALTKLFANTSNISFETLVMITQSLRDESYRAFAAHVHKGTLYDSLKTMDDLIQFLARIDNRKWPLFIESLPEKTVNKLVQNPSDLHACLSLLHANEKERALVLMALGKNRLRELVNDSQACSALLDLLSERENASIVQALGATHINHMYRKHFLGRSFRYKDSFSDWTPLFGKSYHEYSQIKPHLSLVQRRRSEVDEPISYLLLSALSRPIGIIASAAVLLTGCAAIVSLTMTLGLALLAGGLILLGGILLIISSGLNMERRDIEDAQPQSSFSIN